MRTSRVRGLDAPRHTDSRGEGLSPSPRSASQHRKGRYGAANPPKVTDFECNHKFDSFSQL